MLPTRGATCCGAGRESEDQWLAEIGRGGDASTLKTRRQRHSRPEPRLTQRRHPPPTASPPCRLLVTLRNSSEQWRRASAGRSAAAIPPPHGAGAMQGRRHKDPHAPKTPPFTTREEEKGHRNNSATSDGSYLLWIRPGRGRLAAGERPQTHTHARRQWSTMARSNKQAPPWQRPAVVVRSRPAPSHIRPAPLRISAAGSGAARGKECHRSTPPLQRGRDKAGGALTPPLSAHAVPAPPQTGRGRQQQGYPCPQNKKDRLARTGREMNEAASQRTADARKTESNKKRAGTNQ